jgi:nucleoside phosphorylase
MMAGGDRRGTGGAGDEVAVFRAAAPEVSIGRLPHTGSLLFGREREVAWLDRCWEGGACVASIVAWGGVGKSALVNAWLRGMHKDGWRGAERVYGWSFYSQGTTDRMTSADEFVSAALRWFGDEDPAAGSPWDKGERLAGFVRKTRALLVLDGVEPLQWGPGAEEGKIKDPALQALVRALGTQNKGLCVISSRLCVTDVEDYGEMSPRLDLEHLSAEAGAQVLVARGTRGTDKELREAAEEYGGHGLALTLLGSYLEEACEGDIRRRHEIGPLEGDERLGEHARRVMAAYEQWFEGGPEIPILRMLGLFDRSAAEEEIAALTSLPAIMELTDALERIGMRKWNKAIAKLRRVGLLAPGRAGDEDKTLDAHPLVREHFGDRVRREYPEAWREGHRRLYEHLKKKAKRFPETIEEMVPLYSAVVHGCLAGRYEEALREVFWSRIKRGEVAFNSRFLGAFGSEVAMLSAFFDPPWEHLAAKLNEPGRAYVLNAAGFALRALGRLSEAAQLIRMGLELRVSQNDWRNSATSAINLSEISQVRGDLEEALAYARRSVECADKGAGAHVQDMARSTVADALLALGRQVEAVAHFKEARHMRGERVQETQLASSAFGWTDEFSYFDFLMDQAEDADVLKRIPRTLNQRQEKYSLLLDVALHHISLGRAHLLAIRRGNGGNLAQTAVHLKEALEGLRRAGPLEFIPLGLLARADLHTHTGDHVRARTDLDEALTLATRCGFRLHEADTHLAYARLHLAESNPAEARASLARARDVIQKTGYHRRDEELARLEATAANLPESPPPPTPPPITAPAPTAAEQGPAPMPPIDPARAPQQAPIDFLIFAPLEEERDALLSKLPGHRRLDSDGADVHVYFEAEIATRRQDKAVYRVLVTSPGGMGPIHAAVTASAVTVRWQPEHVIVVGIAGGLRGEVSLGDVMVARSVADYTVGKVEEDGSREERWEQYPADASLLHFANAFRTGWEDLVAEPRPEGAEKPARHAGVIASGGDVIASRELIAAYRKDMPKLIGVEMEGGGAAAALHSQRTRPRFLMIRGVSDLADGEGNASMKKRWRACAGDVAAAYAIGLLREGPVPAREGSTTPNPR